jgi:hypothetical protein
LEDFKLLGGIVPINHSQSDPSLSWPLLSIVIRAKPYQANASRSIHRGPSGPRNLLVCHSSLCQAFPGPTDRRRSFPQRAFQHQSILAVIPSTRGHGKSGTTPPRPAVLSRCTPTFFPPLPTTPLPFQPSQTFPLPAEPDRTSPHSRSEPPQSYLWLSIHCRSAPTQTTRNSPEQRYKRAKVNLLHDSEFIFDDLSHFLFR